MGSKEVASKAAPGADFLRQMMRSLCGEAFCLLGLAGLRPHR